MLGKWLLLAGMGFLSYGFLLRRKAKNFKEMFDRTVETP